MADAKPVEGRDVASPDSSDTHEDFEIPIPPPADICPATPASDGDDLNTSHSPEPDQEEPPVPPSDSVNPPVGRYQRY